MDGFVFYGVITVTGAVSAQLLSEQMTRLSTVVSLP